MSLLPVKSLERGVLCRDHLDIAAQERSTTENEIMAKGENRKQNMGGTIAKDEGEKRNLKTY